MVEMHFDWLHGFKWILQSIGLYFNK